VSLLQTVDSTQEIDTNNMRNHTIITETTDSGENRRSRARPPDHLHRGLRGRNLVLISIAGSIGTALFVGIGIPLSQGGPLSLLLGFSTFGLLILLPTQYAVAEMCALLPMESTIFHFADRFVDPAFAFAIAWNYFYGGAIVIALEATAAASLVGFWSSANSGIWIAVALVTNFLVNIYTVRWYGEVESVFAVFKILLITGLIIMTVVTALGANPIHDRYGFRTWKAPGPMFEYLLPGNAGRFFGFLRSLVYAGLVMGGPDVLAMQAGEAQNPRVNIPRAARKVVFRLLFFYLAGALSVGMICDTNDPLFKQAVASGTSGAAGSPWVLGMKRLHITGVTDLLNALILTSVWSGGNSAAYSSSRTLYSLALEGKAPRFLKTLSSRGIPVNCVIVVHLIGCIGFLAISNNALVVFGWLADLATIAWLMTFFAINVTFLRFHAGMKAQKLNRQAQQGDDRNGLPYVGTFQPYWSWIGAISLAFIILANGYYVFLPGKFVARGFVTSYFGIAFGVTLFVIGKLWWKTKLVRLREMDIFGEDKQRFDEEDELVWKLVLEDRRKTKAGYMSQWVDKWL